MSDYEADPLAHPGLALQREGRAGRSTTSGSSTSAGRRCPAPTWRSPCGSPGAATRPSRCSGSTVATSATRRAIIAALERRWPEHPLYPEDPDERRRALELEDYFDEQLGPQIRLLGWHELRNGPASGWPRSRRHDGPGPAARRSPARDAFARALRQHLRPAPLPGRRRRGRGRAPGPRCARGARPARGRARRRGRRVPGRRPVLGRRPDRGGALLSDRQPARGAADPARRPAGRHSRRSASRSSDRPGYQWVEEMFRRHRKPAAVRRRRARARRR